VQNGELPLHAAANFGHLQVVKYFIEQSEVLVDEVDNEKRTALHLAAARGHLDVVKYLLEEQHSDYFAQAEVRA
jgi:ankyrin repeat protein